MDKNNRKKVRNTPITRRKTVKILGASAVASGVSGCITSGGPKSKCSPQNDIQWTTVPTHNSPETGARISYKIGASWNCNDGKPTNWSFKQDGDPSWEPDKEETITSPSMSDKYPKKVDTNKYEIKFEKKWQYNGDMLDSSGKRGIKVEGVANVNVNRTTVRWKSGYPKWSAVSWPLDETQKEDSDSTGGTSGNDSSNSSFSNDNTSNTSTNPENSSQ